jgi:hypothetical protein
VEKELPRSRALLKVHQVMAAYVESYADHGGLSHKLVEIADYQLTVSAD